MILQIKSAEFRFADVTVFKDVNLEVNDGDCIGIVGANGAGKSTLLNCIVGDLKLFDGSITMRNGLSVGYLRQNCDFLSSNTLFDEMMSVFSYQLGLIEQIKNVSEQMSELDPNGKEYRALAEKYHKLTVEADVTEAYNSEVKVKTVLNGMGMTEFSSHTVSTLSGGEKTKAALCKLLLQRPELMILDEPTNHLDYKTLDWLENYLADRKSALLIVSHDRYFLDKLCTAIWEVEWLKVEAYKGNYSKYKVLKEERRKARLAAYEKQQREIAKLRDYIARNKVRASTADMAHSREKMLERMQLEEAPVAESRPPRFEFTYTSEPSEFPLTVRNLNLAYGDKTLLKEGCLQIRRGQKVALLGLNGAGKSTLIKRIASCDPRDAGKIVFGKNVRVGYYDQENLNLDSEQTVLNQLWFDNMKMSQTQVRSLLAQVTLGSDDVNKRVSELSGGERAKLGLAMIMAKDCNMLLLDEPTNHLDLPSREALEDALKKYTGTLLFVSHDRYFVNSLSNNIAELSECNISVYEGNYDSFIEKKTKETFVEKPKNNSAKTYRNAKQRAEETNRARRIRELEKRITELEEEAERLNEEIATPSVASDYTKLSAAVARLNDVNAQLEQAIAEWESLA